MITTTSKRQVIASGEVLPDIQGTDERQLTSGPAIGNNAAVLAFVAHSCR